MGLDGRDGTSLSVASVPHLDSGKLAGTFFFGGHINKLDVEGDVGEVFGDSSSLTLNSDLSGFAGNGD